MSEAGASNKRPCLCFVCKGALVSNRTVIRHRDRPKFIFVPDEESNSEGSGSAEEDMTQNESQGSAGREIPQETRLGPFLPAEERPPKRARTDLYEHDDRDPSSVSPTPSIAHTQINQDARGGLIDDDKNEISESESEEGPSDIIQVLEHRTDEQEHSHDNFSEASDSDSHKSGPSDVNDLWTPDADELQEQTIAQELEMARIVAQLNLQEERQAHAEEQECEAIEQSRIENVRIVQQYTELISRATIENTKLDEPTRDRLNNPLEGPPDISDPDVRLSLDLFMACNNASEHTYTAVRETILRCFPDSEVYTYKQVKRLVADISGVVSVVDDMCINSCHAFTGPFEDLQACHVCGEARYDPKVLASTGKQVARKQACTIPLGPQIQALQRSRESAVALQYRQNKTQEILDNLDTAEDPSYDDIFSGNDFLDLHKRLNLSNDDTTVMFSLDGAQHQQIQC